MLIALIVLAGTLVFAVTRPFGLPEAVAAVPGAVLLVLLGEVPWHAAWAGLRALGPTLGFLAAILVLAHLADLAGIFRYAGHLATRASRGSARRLLVVVFGIAAVVTAALSLDATVVLFTPVVLLTAQTMRLPARPYSYASAHLANSASLLMPVSNLTNLLAFAATGLTFLHFVSVMALPWMAAILVEYLVFIRFFADDLASAPGTAPTDAPADAAVHTPADAAVHTPADSAVHAPADATVHTPVGALVVLGATLAGFAAAAPIGIPPAWVALAGAALLAIRHLRRTPGRRRLAVGAGIVRATSPLFLLFVAALSVIVFAVRRTDLGTTVAGLLPVHAGLAGLLAVAVAAALLANVLNNLPATLVLVPVLAHSPALILAALLGVNIGPNLTYVGSLATLLWRRIVHDRSLPSRPAEFLVLGLATVPAALLAATIALWLSVRIFRV